MNAKRSIFIILCGNMLDYYDFLLFAHLSYIITPYFIPNIDSTQAHILGLFLFALPFVVRPLGGYLFGRISDKKGRQDALSKTLKYASIASFGIAILPGYEQGGLLSAILFLMLRALQGLSLGGEYTTAGTLLMERYKNRQGIISGMLGASGTLGSLLAFFYAWLYLNGTIAGESWRIAFLLGGIGAYVSILLRKQLSLQPCKTATNEIKINHSVFNGLFLTFLIGGLVGLLGWLPMVYTNFYFTKVLHFSVTAGLQATFIALLSYVLLSVAVGMLADKYSSQAVMTLGALLALPLGWIGFICITNGLWIGQIVLTLGAALAGSPLHVVVNQLFHSKNRSTYVNTAFMLGTSVGGLTPAISGYLVNEYAFYGFPLIMLSLFSVMNFLGLYKRFFYNKRIADKVASAEKLGN
jgi:MHS family proline/betaine transporter-like MFS transporter